MVQHIASPAVPCVQLKAFDLVEGPAGEGGGGRRWASSLRGLGKATHVLSATLTNQSVAQRPPVGLVLALCTPHPHEGHSVAGAPLSWLQEQAQIPLTWEARVL